MEKIFYSLEEIITKTAEKSHQKPKLLKKVFRDILINMGVLPTSLQNEKGRYRFSKQSCIFGEKVLENYTRSPYSNVRRCEYDKIQNSFIYEFENMVADTMQNVHKSNDEIRIALVKIDAKTGACQRTYTQTFTKRFEEFILKYWESLNVSSHLLSIDRAAISNYVNKELFPKYAAKILEETSCLVEYFDNERLNEIHSLDDFIEPSLLESIQNSDQYEQLIGDSDSEHRLISSEELTILMQHKSGAEIRKDFKDFDKALKVCDEQDKCDKATTMATISARNSAIAKLDKYRKKIQQNSDKELGITPEDRRRYQTANRKPAQVILAEALREYEDSCLKPHAIAKDSQMERVLRKMIDKVPKESSSRPLVEIFKEAARELIEDECEDVFAETSLEELARKIIADEEDTLADAMDDV